MQKGDGLAAEQLLSLEWSEGAIRVLFVEDDDDFREALCWQLAERGFSVLGFADGDARITRDTPDAGVCAWIERRGIPLDPLDLKTLQTQNPSTLARRSHVSSLLCGNTERTPSGFRWPNGVALFY